MLQEDFNGAEFSNKSESDDNVMPINNKDMKHQKFLHKIVEFIRHSNLNKSTVSSLLSLLRSTPTSTIDDIPTTTNSLWKQLDISFNYETFYFCSICFKQLEKFHDTCIKCKSKQKANSELCIFSLTDEIKRVVASNIKLIEWYQLHENQNSADIVNGYPYISVILQGIML